MDRQQSFSGAIPLNTELLLTNIDSYIGLAKLSAAILGTNNLVNNATCTPTSPASLNIIAGPCEIYSLQNVDNTSYSDVPPDTTHQIVKQGVNLDATTLALTAPGTSGYSQNYLIEFGFLEQDGGSAVLLYYNPSNPSSPFNGPNNTGSPNNTVRQDQVSIIAKAGIAAITGTQTTPSPDSGYVGGFVVTVANGQTQITSGNISNYASPNTGFINETLIQKISQSTADARYVQQVQEQSGQFTYAVDTGSSNAYVCSLSPALTSYTAGSILRVKISNTNTTASTLNVNSLGAKSIKLVNGNALNSGQLVSGMIAEFSYDGTNFQILNPITPSTSGSLISIASFTTSGTWNVPGGVNNALIFCVGAGGGGGGISTQGTSGGTSSVGVLCSATGGSGGTVPGGGAVSSGIGSGGNINLSGSQGAGSIGNNTPSGSGGNSSLGGGAGGVQVLVPGGNGAANSGSGGSGAGCASPSSAPAGGGGGGGTAILFTAVSGSYAITIGAGGSGGSGAVVGGGGGSGLVLIYQYS